LKKQYVKFSQDPSYKDIVSELSKDGGKNNAHQRQCQK
jgi:hypothetical protein